MPSRSPLKFRIMPANPMFSPPIRCSAGTRTSSKWMAAVSEQCHPIFSSGVRDTPGAVRSISSSEMPPVPAPPVRTAVVIQSARMPLVMNILPPLTTYSPPRRSARVVSAATSEPPPASVMPSAMIFSPASTGGATAAFISSVPSARDRRQADAVGHQRRGQPARADAGQLLRLGQRVEDVEAVAVAAVFLRVAEAQDAGGGGLAVEFAGELAGVLPRVDVGRDLARDEGADRVGDGRVGFVVEGRARAPVVEDGHCALPRPLHPRIRGDGKCRGYAAFSRAA